MVKDRKINTTLLKYALSDNFPIYADTIKIQDCYEKEARNYNSK